MKKVAQLANEMGVSVQTIYRKLNSVKQDVKHPLTVKERGITYITTLGEDTLTLMFNTVKTDVKQRVKAKSETVENIGADLLTDVKESVKVDVKVVEILEEQVKYLKEQLAEKERKIDEKDQQIKDCLMMLGQINGEVKKLQAANESISEEKEIIEHRPAQEERKSLFARLVQAFKGE